jgi:hypothetical protein
MRRSILFALSLFALSVIVVCLGSGPAALAGGPNAAKYPLRVYIFRYAVQPETSRGAKHPSDMAEYVSGIGQADLFENGEPRGFQFSFVCVAEMRASAGYETFPARWKKREAVLEILLPEKGKSETMDSCELQPDMMAGQAYFWKNSAVAQEPSDLLKGWMVKHKFDPENSDEEPVLVADEPEGTDPLLAP